MLHTLQKLPYALDALSPIISKETLEYHYGKHHKTYVTNLNNLIINTEFEALSLENIIQRSTGVIFNNAAQVWNHTFYWNSMIPNGSSLNDGMLKKAIDYKWGSVDQFKAEFIKMSLANFGSGWTWLVKNIEGTLDIINSTGAETPLKSSNKALITVDVWEHAYYIDYRNLRAKYLTEFWNIINWNFAEKNFF